MKLFNPFLIKNVAFDNRIVIAPMVPFGIARLSNFAMSNPLLTHYSQLARNAAGLLVTQSLSVTPHPVHDSGVGIFHKDHIPALRTVVQACHSYNTRLFAQLAYPSTGFYQGDSILGLSALELDTIAKQFIQAAWRCKQAGCDGIELHGANSFFLNMLAAPASNQRTDHYGGSLENRLRLVKTIVDGIREFSDENFILSYRMGCTNDPATDIQTAQALQRMGVELIHACSGISSSSRLAVPPGFGFNAVVFMATVVAKHLDIPVIAVNNISTLRRGNDLVEAGQCEFAAYGKPFLADPEFLVHAKENIDYQPCLNCGRCQWFVDGSHCPARRAKDNSPKII